MNSDCFQTNSLDEHPRLAKPLPERFLPVPTAQLTPVLLIDMSPLAAVAVLKSLC
jgi:hypothetical protein